MNSSRTGCASPAGKMSRMPPRTANSPCSSAGSSRVKPASTSSSARSVGAMSWPGFRSSDAARSRSGAVTRGSSAAADATTTRAVPVRDRVQRPRAGRRHADVRRQAAVRIDLVRRKRQHRPLGRRRRQAFERGEEEADVGDRLSRSPSLGTTYSTTPCGRPERRPRRTAPSRSGVSPDTARAGTSMPLRATAVFRTARRLSEVEVATECSTTGNFQCSEVRGIGDRVHCGAVADLLDDRRSSNSPARSAPGRPCRRGPRRCRARRWRLQPSRRP